MTKEGSPDFVPAAERIATFDNDGTLWSEQPLYSEMVFQPMLELLTCLRANDIGKLAKGLDEAQARGWTVVSMKDDWKTIYPAR